MIMEQKEDFFQKQLQLALEKLALDESTEGLVREVLVQNIVDGRVARHFKETRDISPNSYVQLVATNYTQYSVFIHLLKESSQQAVETILPELQASIKQTLFRWNIWLNQDINDKIHDIANDIVLELIAKPFHYECAPLAWAYGIVQNKCCRLVRDAKRRNNLQTIDIDTAEAEEYLTILSTNTPSPDHQVETNLDLCQAYEQLTDKRQMFVHLYYVMGYNYPAIAQMMGVETNSLYKLKSDTLKHLGKIYQSSYHM